MPPGTVQWMLEGLREMETLFGIKKILTRSYRRPTVTIGVFDGVHIGHHKVVEALINHSAKIGGESVVLTFDSHPDVIISSKRAPFITSLRHRLVLLERLGVDVCGVFHTDKTLLDMTAEEFTERILVGALGVKGVVLGFNSTFGKNARGNAAFLREFSQRWSFDVIEVRPAYHEGKLISSTVIREMIGKGEIEAAAKLLGRPVSVLGTVRTGSGRGRLLGFPTVNLDLHHEVHPPNGVYAVKVILFDVPGHKVVPEEAKARPSGQYINGLCNIGYRPTFSEGSDVLVEVHLLDFSGDLRGLDLEVIFIKRLRDEKRFDSPEELIKDIHRLRERCEAEAIFG